jgi:hypothetical protein
VYAHHLEAEDFPAGRSRWLPLEDRLAAGGTWTETGLVFTSPIGTPSTAERHATCRETNDFDREAPADRREDRLELRLPAYQAAH